MRATVLRIWVAKKRYGDPDSVYAMTRFNESVDQALAESMDSYSRELSASRDTFLAILGHDLRSPLSALSGALHILSKSSTDEQRAQALAIGMRSVSAMSAMIRDLLEYTRTRLGKGIPIDPAPGNLETVCREAIAEISLAYRETEFLFESRGLLDGTFDSERIHQVVSNLLNNAVQYGQQGLPVSLGAFRDNGSLVLQVTNHGLPIPPDQLQVIFDPLVQIHAEGSELHRSTNLGLGLFIAREIVLAHRGTIEAASSAEEGTTFTVELPCAARVPYAPAR